MKTIKEFTSAQLATLKKEYEPLKGKRLGMNQINKMNTCLLYTSPSPRDGLLSRMPSSA